MPIKSLIVLALSLMVVAGHSLAATDTGVRLNAAANNDFWLEPQCTDLLPTTAQLTDVMTDSTAWKQRSSRIYAVMPTNPVWCRIVITESDRNAWYLGFKNAAIGHLDVYFSDHQTTQQFQAGDRLPFDRRPIPVRFFYFPVPTTMTPPISIYFRMDDRSIYAPVRMQTYEEMISSSFHRMVLSAMAFSLILPILGGLVVARKLVGGRFKSMRRWGTLLVFSYVMISTVLNGYAFQFMWPDYPEVNNLADIGVILFYFWTAWMFYESALQIHSSTWSVTFYGLLTAAAVAATLSLLPDFSQWDLTLPLLFSIIVLFISRMLYMLWRTRRSIQQQFWLLWFICVSMTILQYFSIVRLNLDLDIFSALNFYGLAALVTFYLYRQIKSNQALLLQVMEEKLEQEMAMANTQRERNEELEDQVTKRTRELANMMKDLHLSNMKLRAASSTDTLTGIMNRYAIDSYLEEQWQYCTEQQRPISVGFIDADYFKKVNDIYGHEAGDECLIQIAKFLTNSLTQVKMRAARYGGEEFIVVAPETDVSQLQTTLESFRRFMEDTDICSAEHTFSVTVSIGIAGMPDPHFKRPKDMVKAADEALYRAKNNGRNRVEYY